MTGKAALILLHLLIALTYTVLAGAVVVVTPLGMTGIEPQQAAAMGGMLWIACLVFHEVVARLRRQARLVDQISVQRADHRRLMSELSGARAQVGLIQEALEAAGRKRRRAAAREIKEVVDEVRVLKGLIERLATRDGDHDAPDGRLPAPRDARRPVPPVARGLDDEQVLDVVRDGLRADRVDLFLQPVVALPQRKRRYFECFSRIRGDDGAMVVPEQYIAIAERAGLISAIDNMLLFRCVQLIRKTRQRRYKLGFFCNISHHTLADAEFFAEFVRFMTSNEELAESLMFEFAQVDLAGQEPAVVAELDRLAAYGFRYSMDQVRDLDFQPAELAARHVAFVKVEAALLLSRIREEDFDLGAFRGGLEEHGVHLIVEKIERESDLVELLDFGVELGQGYLFGEPRMSREP